MKVQDAFREVAGCHRSAVLGLLWAPLNPLFVLAVYAFVFGRVLKSRWTMPEQLNLLTSRHRWLCSFMAIKGRSLRA